MSSTSNTEHPVTPVTPPPAAHYSPRQIQDDMMADFFGARPERTRSNQFQDPPAYSPQGDTESLPAYPGDEPSTLARYMFLYGFLFPPFWVMGIAILLSPLRTTPEWEMNKTEEQKVAMLRQVRAVEVKWAKRCLHAMLVFLVVLALVAVAIYLTRRR